MDHFGRDTSGLLTAGNLPSSREAGVNEKYTRLNCTPCRVGSYAPAMQGQSWRESCGWEKHLATPLVSDGPSTHPCLAEGCPFPLRRQAFEYRRMIAVAGMRASHLEWIRD